MKVALDEDLPHVLRLHLPEHEMFTAAYMGWAGLKNGQLLRAVESAGFDVFVTGDLSMSYQQNVTGRRLAIISLSANNWPIIKPHLRNILAAIDQSVPGAFVRVECGVFSRGNKPKGPTLG